MALFQKNPFAATQHQAIFTLGTEKTILVVGLGNIGKQYKDTRHNVGFACLDALAQAHEFDPWTEKKDLRCLMTSKTLGDTRVILIKPTTYMNESGQAVQKTAHFYKVDTQHTAVVHDELDIPFGQIRTRQGGSAAGHNGIKSTLQHIGPDFGRIRIGIEGSRPDHMNSADYVLAKFSAEEQAKIPDLTREVTSILTEYIYSGQLPHDTRSFLV